VIQSGMAGATSMSKRIFTNSINIAATVKVNRVCEDSWKKTEGRNLAEPSAAGDQVEKVTAQRDAYRMKVGA
jgi:hypothetical protein